MLRRIVRFTALLVLPISLLPTADVAAQDKYRDPPEPIRRILDAEPTPAVSVSPDRTTLLLMRRPGLPPIAEVAAPEYRLAGIRFDPRSNGPTREFSVTGLSVMPVGGGAARPIALTLPAGATIANTRWSPKGDRIAFTVTTDDAITLWLADVASATAKQLTARRLNGILGPPCEWVATEPSLLCAFVPANRQEAPKAPSVPDGPIVQEAGGAADRVATFQDLLKSPYDEALFTHYATAQLGRVSMDGAVTELGKPAMVNDFSASPDGRFILVSALHAPFSYTVPVYYFPTLTEVWDATGATVKRIYDRPLVQRVPWGGDAAVPGPRSVQWRPDAAATVVWTEALDEGDPARQVPKRDRILALEAPFGGEPRTLLETEWRAGPIMWGGAKLAIAREQQVKARKVRTWIIDPSQPGGAPRLLWDKSSEDRYGNPGNFVMTTDARGQSVLALAPDGKSAFLIGQGASPEGDRPFLDRLDLASGKATRLFHSTAPSYEVPVALLDARGDRILTVRESKSEPPNYFHRDLVRRVAPRQLTTFSDPAPAFAGVTSELITYTRSDGVQLSATLYLPPGYDKAKDGPLPFFFWAYPLEYRSRAAASQVVGSPYRFTRPNGASHLFLLLQGYGVLDNPTMPIVGENGAEPNDTYVEQLTASAKAAVDKVTELGVADRNRIGVGGHSYGGFMTANLLAHSRLFRAGVARSGAYNRTLTPFGFQGEERSYWQAEDIYTKMSPFTYADSVEAPILLIHGMADDNTGTYPVQSERYFAALKGNGKTVRYVQLPAEAHGYRARESIGHTLWETVAWLDKYVKGEKVLQ